MKPLWILMLTILTAACASKSPETLVMPDGKRRYLVECLDKEQNCYPKAKKLCPQGYFVTDTKYRAIMNWQGFDVQNTLKFTLIVECKEEGPQ